MTKREGLRKKLTRWAGGPNLLAGELGLEGIHQLYKLLGLGGLYSKGGIAIEDELKSIDQRLDKIAAEKTEVRNQHGDTPAQKEKMIHDWLTRPKTKYESKLQRLAKEKGKEKFKYQSWNGKTEPMEITDYIDKVKKNYE